MIFQTFQRFLKSNAMYMSALDKMNFAQRMKILKEYYEILPYRDSPLKLFLNRRWKNKLLHATVQFSYFLIVICITFYTSSGVF